MIHEQKKKVTIRFAIWLNKERKEFQISGQTAKSLLFLVNSHTKGITPLEMSSWALRLAAYVHILRHEYGIEIRTDKEKHQGGSHARYVLITPVEIIGAKSVE